MGLFCIVLSSHGQLEQHFSIGSMNFPQDIPRESGWKLCKCGSSTGQGGQLAEQMIRGFWEGNKSKGEAILESNLEESAQWLNLLLYSANEGKHPDSLQLELMWLQQSSNCSGTYITDLQRTSTSSCCGYAYSGVALETSTSCWHLIFQITDLRTGLMMAEVPLFAGRLLPSLKLWTLVKSHFPLPSLVCSSYFHSFLILLDSKDSIFHSLHQVLKHHS